MRAVWCNQYYSYSLTRCQYLARYLAQYGSDWRIRRLAIKKLDQSPKSLLVLQTCAAHDVHSDIRLLIVETLIAGWKGHFITLAVLVDRAEDDHIAVQHLCVNELAHWDHPAALSCMERIARNASFTIKFIAIETLEGWKNQLS